MPPITPSFAEPLLALTLPHAPQALLGYLGSGKSRTLRASYEALLRRGHRAERVLVWVANFSQANVWKDTVRGFDFAHGATQVLTFRSWVRRELLMNWPLIESSGLLTGAPKTSEPFLVGLAASQQLLRDLVEPMIAEYPALDRCYTVPAQRLIQVLDTYARLVEHGLNPSEAALRLDRAHALGPDSEELHRFVGDAIARYRAFCFEHRVLDYNVQLELFTRALWSNRAYRERLADDIDVLLVDNIEETMPVAQTVIEALLDSCAGVMIARDQNGGLREYLGGDPIGADRLLMRCAVTETNPPSLCAPEMAGFGRALAEVALAGPEDPPPTPVLAPSVRLHAPHTLRVQMFEAIGKRLHALLKEGIRPNDIVVVAPVVDPLLSWHLRQVLAKVGQPLRVLSGSNRVIDHRPVRILVTLARLARPSWNAPPSEPDVAEALEALLDLHALEGPHLQKLVYVAGELVGADVPVWPKHLQGRQEAYAAIFEWVDQMRRTTHPLDRLFEDGFAHLYAPRRLRSLAPDAEVAGHPVATPYAWGADEALEILQIEQLIQSARAYRKLAAAICLPAEEVPRRFLRSIYAGELAERPLIPKGSMPEAVTLFTASKYAEEGPPAAVQLWIDAAAPQWHKSDLRELMNPRVLSRHWASGPYTDEHDQRHQAEKLARTLHTMALKATGQVEVFSSDYGSDGSELGGELAYWLSELVSTRVPRRTKAGGQA